MSYETRDPSGKVVANENDVLVALDVMHRHGKGSTVWRDGIALIATCEGPFDMFHAGREGPAGHAQNKLPALFATAWPRVGLA